MKGQDVIFSSGENNWSTPKGIYNDLNEEFEFDFDPCPLNSAVKLSKTLFDEVNNDEREVYDGLNVEWGESNFVNPPYSDIAKWIEKSYLESKKGKTVVLLIPSRTDTKAFHKYVLPFCKEIRFCKGRLKFGDAKNSAPFPSMVVIF